MTSDIVSKALESIVVQWNGGERKLAGARASELVFGKSNKPDQKTMDNLTSRCPGIEEFIVAPSQPPVEIVTDKGGNPNARGVENTQTATAQNLSSEAAKSEQDEIDEALAPGREKRGDKGDVGSTKLNPAGSDRDPDPKSKGANPHSAKTK